jgi:RHS repeat-associated protein/uncharacterized delta-60 repeat protein
LASNLRLELKNSSMLKFIENDDGITLPHPNEVGEEKGVEKKKGVVSLSYHRSACSKGWEWMKTLMTPAAHDSDGIAVSDTSFSFTNVKGMGVQSDGKIILGGSSSGQFLLVRFAATGTLDTTFDSDGYQSVSFGTNTATLNAVAIQADDKIVAIGTYNSDFALARLTADSGALDASFDSDGKQTSNLGGTDAAKAVRLAADGKIVVVGDSAGNLAVARYTTAGVLDTTFDSDGYLTTDFGSTEVGNGLWIGPDYKITAAGRTGTNGATWDFAVARYKVSSSLEERIYAETDANHNVTSIADVFGAVKERFVYDPYGTATVVAANWSGVVSDSADWIYRDQGGRWNGITNLTSFRHRDFSVSLGRWVEQDPSGYNDGANRFDYEKSNPISAVDPNGLKALKLTMMAFIPRNHGNYVSGSPIPLVTWVTMPGLNLAGETVFNTDDRMTVRGNGSYKVRLVIDVDTDEIGHMNETPKLIADSHPTKSIQVISVNPVSNTYAFAYKYIPGTLKTSNPTPTGGVSGFTNFNSPLCDSTTISFIGSATDPFLPSAVTPSVDIDASWTLRKKSSGITVQLQGEYDLYPAYGGLANSTVVYQYSPSGTNPGFWNLSTSMKFTSAEVSI